MAKRSSSSRRDVLRDRAVFLAVVLAVVGTGICGRERPGTRLPYSSPRLTASCCIGGAKPNLPFGFGTAPCFSNDAILSRRALGPLTAFAFGRTWEVLGFVAASVCCCWRAAIRALRPTGGTGALVEVLWQQKRKDMRQEWVKV